MSGPRVRAPLTRSRLSMADLLARFFTQPFTVRRRTGDGAVGPIYADPVTLQGRVNATNRLVIDDRGNQVLSAAKISMSVTEDDIPTGSQVRVGDGPWRTVIAESRHVGGFRKSPDYYSIDLN
ncbi:head-tail connector protein [Gordonia phage ThankyouJordi]|uniref:Head-to-tail stopper n=1 Tax=Gordonia phage ThankyouJordi TaxID=2571252 RepID=A0A4Y6EKA0_9CAUD|nr:head-tail connector protein [Gordonia phage ThankyouJordi]QDF17771.1 head-to-tail stopper [Gordonia phage ThankyouJordi]